MWPELCCLRFVISPIIQTWVGLRYYFAGKYDDAIAEYRKALELDPDFAPAHWHLGWAYEQAGRFKEGVSQAGLASAVGLDRTAISKIETGHRKVESLELQQLGWEPHHARTLALRFRRHNVAQVIANAAHWKDEARLITAAKQGRRQLEEQFAQEREEAKQRQRRAGWSTGVLSDTG